MMRYFVNLSGAAYAVTNPYPAAPLPPLPPLSPSQSLPLNQFRGNYYMKKLVF